jgi:hypothetical protein
MNNVNNVVYFSLFSLGLQISSSILLLDLNLRGGCFSTLLPPGGHMGIAGREDYAFAIGSRGAFAAHRSPHNLANRSRAWQKKAALEYGLPDT